MSQTAVNDEPVRAYEGKLHTSGAYPNSIISRIASGTIYFGKAVTPVIAQLDPGDQEVAAPTSAAEALRVLGVAMADVSMERLRDPATPAVPNSAPFGAYSHEDSVSIVKKGQVWVVTTALISDLADGVFIRVANAGGTPPAEALGSFAGTNTADHEPAPAGMKWLGGVTIGGVHFGLLDIDL